MKHHTKLLLMFLPVILIVTVLFFFHAAQTAKNKERLSLETTFETKEESDSLSDKLDKSIQQLDSLTPVVKETIAKIKYYQGLKDMYESEVHPLVVYKTTNNDSAVKSLKEKLAYANNQIALLKSELARVTKKSPGYFNAMIETPEPETPDQNSVVIRFNGSSKNGDVPIPQNLIVYLIPYSKKVKKIMVYEPSCDESVIRSFSGYRVSKYYNGDYFFNDVQPGKYLIKVCTYYGNFMLFDKYTGSQSITMQISPPLQ